MHLIATILTLVPLTLALAPIAPIMSIPPTESSPLPATRLHARQTRIACPIFDPLILRPLITLAPTLPPLDLTPTQTIPPIPGILLTPCQTTMTLTPLRELAPTAPYSTVRSLALLPSLIRLVAPHLNLGPRASQGGALSL